ncbi:CRISPR-associated protein Cas5 [Mycobacterium hubeiense]|uniref:CRISPR-associated protein Cas5 n=1 Tax=Mycobacterium hubeiense TaxID=1867256 RepID=UPI0013044A2B|nr:CRISPR-associated protein Cas5 [Mycobacterium sp. QGD 101]
MLIRLEAPMQSWGLSGRGPNSAHRQTQLHPTKSGVIGLVANVLGRDYSDAIDDLSCLRFAVRADRPGRLETDYHTTGSGQFPWLPGAIYNGHPVLARTKPYVAGEPFDAPYVAPATITRDATGKVTAKPGLTVVTQDWYLADASFLAALTGDVATTGAIAVALAAPARTPYLGRRAYLPSEPLLEAHIDDDDTVEVLRAARRASRSTNGPLDMWVEPLNTNGDNGIRAAVMHDQPISYAGPARRGARLEYRTHTAAAADGRDFYTPDSALNPETP